MTELHMYNMENAIDELFELEMETNKMIKNGKRIYYEFFEKTIYKRTDLFFKIDKMLDDTMTFNEAYFKLFWQGGYISKWNICKTKETYINTIKKYVDLYGKPLEKDTTMYKAVEENEDLFGGSWTKDWKSACNFAAKHKIRNIVYMVVPKGTKTIHFFPNFRFKESEDLISTTDVINETLNKFAELKHYKQNAKKGTVIGAFELKRNNGIYLHELDAFDTDVLFSCYMDAA